MWYSFHNTNPFLFYFHNPHRTQYQTNQHNDRSNHHNNNNINHYKILFCIGTGLLPLKLSGLPETALIPRSPVLSHQRHQVIRSSFNSSKCSEKSTRNPEHCCKGCVLTSIDTILLLCIDSGSSRPFWAPHHRRVPTPHGQAAACGALPVRVIGTWNFEGRTKHGQTVERLVDSQLRHVETTSFGTHLVAQAGSKLYNSQQTFITPWGTSKKTLGRFSLILCGWFAWRFFMRPTESAMRVI